MSNKREGKKQQIADKMYEAADYEKQDRLSKGLADTHEQVSDTYMEGTIDGEIDQVNEEGSLISHEGTKINQQREEGSRHGKKE
ncbi:YozQ family protein [Thalassobacillus pellis]|uniref:YozQ family protein n=1 Tax=Thalassobacillus pellis TaxID=748008 RepID=UPI001961FEE9|nr:YozQ family protein [Thalassobacillus pellis]MBM7553811.1 hypothetical protein [Thalassobacillus pellis]